MWCNFKASAGGDEDTTFNGLSTSSLFRISSDEAVTAIPTVMSEIQNNKLVLSIDQSLFLLQNEQLMDSSVYLSLGSPIDAMCVSQSGSLVICALADGNIHGIHIEGVPVFNLTIDEEDISTKGCKTFISINQVNGVYFLGCSTGRIYRLFNVDEHAMAELVAAYDDEDMAEAEDANATILNNVTIDRISTTQYSKLIDSYCVLPHDEHSHLHNFIRSGQNVMYFQDAVAPKVKLPNGIQRIKSLYNLDHFILGLSDCGKICQICPYTECIVNIMQVDYLIDDIVVIENNADVIELLVLTSVSRLGNRVMKIVEYPSMKSSYELSLPEFAWLIRQPKSSMNMYYLHGIPDGKLVHEIEMRIISETQPEQRLKTLIQKGRLDEAEEYAGQSGLSLQPVHEARTRRLVIEIGTISQKDMTLLQNKFNDLLQMAGRIDDSVFLLSLRHIDIADRGIKRTFLEFLVANVKADADCADLENINEQLRRLNTLDLIDPYDCQWDWKSFVFHPDLMSLVANTFKADMPTACLIWKHHSGVILPFKNLSVVEKTLNTIPTSAPPFDIILWTRHFVPVVALVHPESLSLIADWCMDKTRSLQYSQHWPEIGLEFITNIFNVFDETKYLFSHIRRYHDANIAKMQAMISALQDLDSLNKKYNLTMTLDDFTNDQLEDIALRILQRVALRHLAEMTREFLFPLFIRRGRNAADSIVSYIHFLVTNRKALTHWQERSVTALQQMHQEDNRMECALLILKAAPVPWSNALDPLLAYRSSSHPLAQEISTQYDLQTIKILKAKYDWPIDSIDNHMKLGFRIVKLGLPEMFDDIQILAATDKQLRASIYFHCAYELTRTGQIGRATAFVQSLSAEHSIECSERALNIMANMMDHGVPSDECCANFVEFLNIVSDKLTGERALYDSVRRQHRLRRDFGIRVKIDELNVRAKCEAFLFVGISHIKERLRKIPNVDFVSKCWSDAVALADTLVFDRVQVIVQLLCQLPDVHFSCAMAKWVLELCTVDVDNADHWMDLAALLLAQQIDALPSGEFPLIFPLAYQLLQRTVGIKSDPFNEFKRILAWPRIGNEAYGLQEIEQFFAVVQSLDASIINRIMNDADGAAAPADVKRRESLSIFEKVTETETTAKAFGNAEPIVKCVTLALKMFLTLKVQKHQLLDKIGKFYAPDFDADEESKTQFIQSLEHLIKSKQYSAAFTIIQNTLDTQKALRYVVIPDPFVTAFHKKVLRFSLSQKEPNFVDIKAILLSDPRPNDCIEYLSNELKSGPHKINYLTLMELYSQSSEDKKSISVNRKMRMEYFYYTELCKVDTTLKSCGDLNFASVSSVLQMLQHNVLEVSLLERMSKDFDWNFQEALVTQIITILKRQKLEFSIRLDRHGQEEIDVAISVDAILQSCKPYINELGDTATLANELIRLMDTINFYFYELYLTIIEILMYVDRLPVEMEVWRSILLFLKHKMVTKRRNRIGQSETDAWLHSQHDAGVLPQIARFRFPFRPIVQEPLKNVLDDELSVENCEQWFPLIQLHAALPHESDNNDSPDYFCMSAVKNSISEYKHNASLLVDGSTAVNGKPRDSWNTQPTNNAFLQSVLRLLKHMESPSRKLFILYFVCNQAPEGADQVDVAYECYRFAIENEATLCQMARAEDIVVKIKIKYPSLKTQHLLHVYGLADHRLLQLMGSPSDLIHALYSHPSILKTPLGDINKVAEEIAELYSLNLREIQIVMLDKWLSGPADGQTENMDETFYEDLNVTVQPDEMTDEQSSVERIYYIMISWPVEEAIQLLVSYIFADGASETGKQLQAFECFMKIVDQFSENVSSSYKDYITQEHYVVLKCVHFLKQLGYKFTVAKFMEYDKLTILKKVWASHAKVPMAMEVMALICSGYDIYMPQIWNGVLKQMVAMNMIDQLSVLVNLLSTKTNLLRIDGLQMAWEYVIMSPFRSANQTQSVVQEHILRKGLFYLQSCPLASKLNLLELASTCVRLNRPHMAAVMIQLANENIRKHIVKMVLEANGPALKDDLVELESFGIYPTLIKFALTQLKL